MAHELFLFGERLIELRVREEHKQAAQRGLVREALKAREGRAARPRDRVLCRAGRLLLALGERLLQAGAQPAAADVAQVNVKP